MSQIPLHRLIIFSLLSLVFMKEITPIDVNSKEVLNIYNKDRDYYNLFQNKVNYIVEGPCILEIHSRLAFPQLTKKIKPYQFSVVITGLNFKDSLTANHHFRKDLNVFSLEHPKYSYTVSGKDIINIPKGKHKVELNSADKVLVRLISRPFKKKRSMSSIKVTNDIDKQILKNDKDVNSRYFSLVSESGKNKLNFNIEGPRIVEISSRIGGPLGLDNSREYYQFKIRQDGELKGVYHMFAYKSEYWQLVALDSLPGGTDISVKRKSYLKVPAGNHDYELELIHPDNKNVFFRLNQEK